jgi:hypothetical protein
MVATPNRRLFQRQVGQEGPGNHKAMPDLVCVELCEKPSTRVSE